jgi:Flp pilus assembly protein TadG
MDWRTVLILAMVCIRNRKSAQRGNAVVEAALMAPWIFLLFVAVFDFGFYAYAAIATAHATRVAAMYTSGAASTAGDSTTACTYVLEELKYLPNVGSAVTSCGSLPVIVTATSGWANDPAYPAVAYTTSTVSVTYQTIQLFPIPWLMGQMTITRTAQMRAQD